MNMIRKGQVQGVDKGEARWPWLPNCLVSHQFGDAIRAQVRTYRIHYTQRASHLNDSDTFCAQALNSFLRGLSVCYYLMHGSDGRNDRR